MNSEEGTSLAKMAVAVLLVVLVIGAVVAIVYAAYSWFNSGTSKLSDQVMSIDKSAYSQYDDAQVSGTDVLSALKSYRESDIAILIMNNQNNSGNPAYDAAATTAKCMNYCAMVIPEADANGLSTITKNDTSGLWEVDKIDFNGAVAKRNTNFSPTTTTSNAQAYVKQSAKWYANLVYSKETGDVCGIMFRQMN